MTRTTDVREQATAPVEGDDRPPTTDDRSVVAPAGQEVVAPTTVESVASRQPAPSRPKGSVVAPEAPAVAPAAPEDFLPILGVEYVEFWVGNALQAAQYYRTHFGFDVIAYAGPETGIRDRASYVLRQGQITFVFTAPLGPEGEIARHVALHGDGVRDIALRVPDVESAFRETTRRGALPAAEPHALQGSRGTVRKAAIHIYGDTLHSFVDRSAYEGVWMPRYRRVSDPSTGSGQAPSGSGQRVQGAATGLAAIDHMVGNVPLGGMDEWARFYRDVMGFSQLVHFTDEQVSTEYTALMSKVMQNGTGRVKFPINEPAPGKKKSQIDEFLAFYRGPGVQHLALITADIVQTVRALRRNGVRFLRVPDSYYSELQERVGPIQESLEDIRELGILVDRDDEGYLLQIFTKPVQDRPTLFYEIIQRRGARGFGLGNFKALFQALELEQAARGNL